MKWSYQIARIAGIPIKLHGTFLLIFGLLLLASGSIGGIANGAISIVVLFGSVLLHELGHALTARRFGVNTRDITLLPIGGVAMLERFPDDPKQEVVIAAAGPAVSFAIALAAYPLHLLTNGTPFGLLFFDLAAINGILGLFNLIPALPMDGGRIFRGTLTLFTGRSRATKVASTVAKVFAAGFIGVGLFTSPMLVVIGLFVYFAASMEQRHERVRGKFDGITAGQVMVTDFNILTPETTIGSAARVAGRRGQEEFPVVRAGFVVGTVRRGELWKAAANGGEFEPVASLMRPVKRFARINTPLIDLAQDVFARDGSTVPVLDGNRLVGLVLPQNFAAAA